MQIGCGFTEQTDGFWTKADVTYFLIFSPNIFNCDNQAF